ncbi:MAG: CHAT domain-containing protein [Richelia sp. RM1_1_1]|nr:CHAT domain-containing protein [Richelia sp. RM1_1_1]
MSLEFSHQNLQGYSFKNQDLKGADFSYSDIRGTNFTNAILKGANFHHAVAGVQNFRVIFLMAFSFFMAALCGYASGLTGIIASQSLSSIYSESTSIITGISGITNDVAWVTSVIIFSLLGLFFIGTFYRGFAADVWFILAGSEAVIIVIVGLIAVIIWGTSGLKAAVLGAWGAAGAGLWSLVGVITIALVVFWSASESIFEKILKVAAWILGLSTSIFIFSAVFQVSNIAFSLTITLAIIVSLLGIYTGIKALAEDEKYRLIRTVAIVISTIGGTNFCNANLTDANLSHAILKNTNFTNAILIRTNFHLAKQLELSRVRNTILNNSQVRNLVVSKKAANKSYQNCNLQGANLANANLNDINFTEADISLATFANAWLERANLTKAQALNTNFQQAKLTAACLEGWNIDSTTQLEKTNCDYIFLLNNHKERRPSSGEFALGEFAKLFKIVLNTVDLIFRNGLDLQALSTALIKVREENPDTEIAIQSIENKGDGVVVVRVEVPEHTNKQKIHAAFTQSYELALQSLEARYQAELESKEEQIALYRQHQTDLRNLMQIATPNNEKQEKVVILNLNEGDLNSGFTVTLRIAKQGNHPYFESKGKLPPAPKLKEYYHQWRIVYRQSLGINFRLDIPDTQITNISRCDYFYECSLFADKLRENINYWLNSDIFRPIKEQLLEQLNPTDSIRMILQTEDIQVRKLPLQLWNFFDRYPKAEIALSTPTYQSKEKVISTRGKVRILAILGNSCGIDIQKDRELLESLPNAEVTFLVEPQRQQLNDQLWTQCWNILFFAGHSFTGLKNHRNSEYTEERDIERKLEEEGYFYLNKSDILTILELKYALKKAIEKGLALGIFNSCDGLGLATSLADLQLPQMIVMREPLPDKVAQEFLKNFLQEYSHGKTLYQSVRAGREKLQGLENEFPCATWLPVICQNPGEIPPLW